MIKSFADKRTQELYSTGEAKRFPPDVAKRAARKLEYVNLATKLDDLKVPSGNRIGFTRLKVTERDNLQSQSTISGAFAFGSATAMLTMLRFVTIIKTR